MATAIPLARSAPAWTNNPPDSRGNAYPDEYVAWQSTVVDVYPNTQSAISREGSNSVRGDVVSLQIGKPISLTAYRSTTITDELGHVSEARLAYTSSSYD